MRKYPGGRRHVDRVTLTTGRLATETFGGGKETIPVTKMRIKIAATATPTVINFGKRAIVDVAFGYYQVLNCWGGTRFSPEDIFTELLSTGSSLMLEVTSDP